MTQAADRAERKYDVRSVSRAIAMLEYLGKNATSSGLSVTEVAEALDMSKSAAFATLQTLQQHGFVDDDGEGQSRRYRLGTALARLGELARGQLSLRDIVRPILGQLASEIGVPARLAVLEGNHAVMIEQVDPPKRVNVDLRMRLEEQLHSTGVGKALLAHLPESDVIARLNEAGMPAETPHTFVEIDKLLAHLDEVRQVGYAVDDEESAEGIFCIGSAVFDSSGHCVGAIGVTGLKLGATSRRYGELGRTVRDFADQTSARLGWVKASS